MDPNVDGQVDPNAGSDPGAGAAPNLVDFEFEGEKLSVPESVATKLKSGVMAHSDYSRKTAEIAETRRALEADMGTAKALNDFLEDNPDQADVVNAIFSGDKGKARELLEAAQEEGGVEKVLQARIDKLERNFQNKAMNDNRNNTIQSYFDDVRRDHPDFDNYANEMGDILAKKNPAYPVYLAASMPARLKEAKESGYKEGMQQALKDFEDRLVDTPPIGGAGGDAGSRQSKTPEAAAARALAKIRQQG